MKIPSKIQKLLDQQEKLSMHLMSVSSKIDNWLDENGADFPDPDIKDSVLTGCLIYTEPGSARRNVEEYINNKSVYLASKSIDTIDAVNKGYAYGYNKAITDFVNRLSEYLCMENATKYGNKDAEQQRNSYDTLMKYEIADAVYDVAEQLKSGVEDERA